MRLGLVGYGYWGEKWARVMEEAGVLAWVYDRDAERRALAAERGYNTLPTHPFISGAEDGAVIATPASSHAGLTKKALDRNLHTLVEKPAALCGDSVYENAVYAVNRGLTYMVDHTFLYEEMFWDGLARAENDIGEIRHIEAVWTNDGIVRDDVDVVWNVMSHPLCLINQIRSLWDAEAHLKGNRELRDNDHLDHADAFLEWPNLTAHVQVNWASMDKRRLLRFCGTEGRTVVDFVDGHVHTQTVDGHTELHVPSNPPEPLSVALSDFLYSIEVESYHPVASAITSGYEVVSCLESLSR